jgi:hypothetical protein
MIIRIGIEIGLISKPKPRLKSKFICLKNSTWSKLDSCFHLHVNQHPPTHQLKMKLFKPFVDAL